jgi:hypothetical protein
MTPVLQENNSLVMQKVAFSRIAAITWTATAFIVGPYDRIPLTPQLA